MNKKQLHRPPKKALYKGLNNSRPKSNLSCADTSAASDVFCFLLVKIKELKIKEEEEEVSWLGRAVMEVSCLHEVKTCQSVRVGSVNAVH